MLVKSEIYNLTKKITDNLFATRPKGDVIYRPCIKNDVVSNDILREIYVDLKKMYPDAVAGDYAFVKTRIIASRPEKVALKVNGNVEIYLNDKALSRKDNDVIHMDVKTGDILSFKCIASEDSFGVGFTLSTVFYPGMWACDYLLWLRATMPVEEYYGEDGVSISKLNSDEIAFPNNTSSVEYIDFKSIYPDGNYAFALTYALSDTYYNGEGDAFVNGEKYDGSVIKSGSSLLVRVNRKDNFSLNTGDDSNFGLDFIESNRKNSPKWLLLGGFDEDTIPEIQFTRPYNGQFWRLCDGSYLRPYLDTHFYGQWFYALMVGQYGILKASGMMGEELKEYFVSGMSIMADFFDYMHYDASVFGSPCFLQRSIKLSDLDSIGTMGMNFCDLYSLKPSDTVKHVIDSLYDAMCKNIPRFSDGTFHRETTMWSDDTFMSMPFLARLGKLTGDDKYFEECICQINGFFKRLFMEDEKLISHIYFLEDEKANRVPWGRGNGWVFITLSEVLERMPDSFEEKEDIIRKFRLFAEGIRAVQDESGMWHQVLNMPSSYKETSCTGMFALGMLRGVKNGWLDDSYMEIVENAITAIKNEAVDSDGNVIGVCRGSECSYDPLYYAKLGTVVNDDHGTGIILSLLCEYYKYVF